MKKLLFTLTTSTLLFTGAFHGVDTASAAQSKGWVQSGGKWSYYSTQGAHKGWLSNNGSWYYLNGQGIMQTGWLYDGAWYYLKPSGNMATGWINDAGKWYYLNKNGTLKTGWLKEGNSWYYLQSNGVMQTGWHREGDTWYFLNSSGAMQTGWLTYQGETYYFNNSGMMMTDWQYIGGSWYNFDRYDGYMNTNTMIFEGDDSYLLGDDGKMVVGWYNEDGIWYYYNPNGALASNIFVDGYYIGMDGTWIEEYEMYLKVQEIGNKYGMNIQAMAGGHLFVDDEISTFLMEGLFFGTNESVDFLIETAPLFNVPLSEEELRMHIEEAVKNNSTIDLGNMLIESIEGDSESSLVTLVWGDMYILFKGLMEEVGGTIDSSNIDQVIEQLQK
ncbi:hypothetical protein FZW96_07240 [Bacillus sp. BGMRC 2118]|nr:hypothetical protein FZW96_07240 [Bacillus sp. BGMRC 2118]